jgi:phage terminase small subunit
MKMKTKKKFVSPNKSKKPKLKKKSNVKKNLKKIKKELVKVKDEWNKAVNDLQNFDPMKDFDMSNFKLDMDTNL